MNRTMQIVRSFVRFILFSDLPRFFLFAEKHEIVYEFARVEIICLKLIAFVQYPVMYLEKLAENRHTDFGMPLYPVAVQPENIAVEYVPSVSPAV